ncbi:hypothetical protein DY000_02007693 [Brassica cretica]|uniref:Pex N-terminal domain-containing protein n=1 Tax=Brassica cretica TaxID=69181 RepID=A0ABQ7C130_BRACR|nr:hypothetical protein DY000_02007693 [Brassica cretica]
MPVFLRSGPSASREEAVKKRNYLGELYGLGIGIHEVLYSYYFAPLTIMPEFYHLQPRDGTALVEEPSRDVARPVSFLGEAMAKQVLAISRRFRRVPFLVSKEVLRHSRLWGNIARLTALVLYEEYQQAGTRRRRSFYTPPPHLARAAPPTARIRPDSAGTPTGGVRASARWELMKEWLEGRTEHWDPEEEYRQHLLWSEGLGRRPGGVSPISPSSDDIGLGGPSGDPEDPGITVGPEVIKNLEFYLFQVRPLPIPVGISHSAARELATIEFPCCMLLLQEATGPRCALGCTWVLAKVGQDRRSLGPDPARLPL